MFDDVTTFCQEILKMQSFSGEESQLKKGYFVSTEAINKEIIRKYIVSKKEESEKRNLSFDRNTLIKGLELMRSIIIKIRSLSNEEIGGN